MKYKVEFKTPGARRWVVSVASPFNTRKSAERFTVNSEVIQYRITPIKPVKRTWFDPAKAKPSPVPIVKFLRDIITVCKKHNLSIAHEDNGGAFLVEEFKRENILWIQAARDYRLISKKP